MAAIKEMAEAMLATQTVLGKLSPHGELATLL